MCIRDSSTSRQSVSVAGSLAGSGARIVAETEDAHTLGCGSPLSSGCISGIPMAMIRSGSTSSNLAGEWAAFK